MTNYGHSIVQIGIHGGIFIHGAFQPRILIPYYIGSRLIQPAYFGASNFLAVYPQAEADGSPGKILECPQLKHDVKFP